MNSKTFLGKLSFVAIIFLAGLPFRIIFLLFFFAVGAAVVAYFSLSHVQSRVDRFLDPSSGDTFQIEQSWTLFVMVVYWEQGQGKEL